MYVASMKTKHFMPFLVLIFMLTSGVLVGCSQPSYFKAPGEPVRLVNNNRAYDHTWREVWEFLAWDATDKEAYTLEHMSGFFAEKLHNRAEYYGFKTAFVVVEFETGEPHALNAFNTVDYGLVYVDSTRKGRFVVPVPAATFIELAPVEHWDKVAYIVEGEKMGFISLGYNENNFNYAWYKKSKATLEDFNNELNAYNKEVEAYNSRTIRPPERDKPEIDPEVEKELEEFYRKFGIDRPTPKSQEPAATESEWSAYLAEGQRLKKEGVSLQAEWKEVRGYAWKESDSPVSRVRVYW